MDEKIVITQEECNSATPGPTGAPWSMLETNSTELVEHRKGWKGIVLAILITSFVFVFFGMVFYCTQFQGRYGHGPDRIVTQVKTVEQYRAEIGERINSQLSDSNHAWRKYVEDAHLSVKVVKAYVNRCSVSTIDGSALAGMNDSNISEIDLVIRFFWEGMIDEGHTDLEIVIDKRADKILKAEIIDTTAIVNTADPNFWKELGSLFLL